MPIKRATFVFGVIVASLFTMKYSVFIARIWPLEGAKFWGLVALLMATGMAALAYLAHPHLVGRQQPLSQDQDQ